MVSPLAIINIHSELQSVNWKPNQLGRRNLQPYQRAELALKLEDVFREKAKENQKVHGGTAPGRTLSQISAEPIDTRSELARVAGASLTQISAITLICPNQQSGNSSPFESPGAGPPAKMY
ncbi:MAG: hypothetical protein KKG33_05275 [candidate division Zixibacteria bacterium]|nr:hypothetical protein [candidate division Zixibacteria bacterium]